MIGDLISHAAVGVVCLTIGWYLPQPQFVRDFFVRIGWASPK